jgi:hypothetical protein
MTCGMSGVNRPKQRPSGAEASTAARPDRVIPLPAGGLETLHGVPDAVVPRLTFWILSPDDSA